VYRIKIEQAAPFKIRTGFETGGGKSGRKATPFFPYDRLGREPSRLIVPVFQVRQFPASKL
jgi:hypothetical protein